MGTAKSSMVRRTGPLVRSLFMVNPPLCNHSLSESLNLKIIDVRHKAYPYYSGNGSGRQGEGQTLIFPKEMLKM